MGQLKVAHVSLAFCLATLSGDSSGETKIEWNNFTNCGVRHIQETNTKEVSLDQEDYIRGPQAVLSRLGSGASTTNGRSAASRLQLGHRRSIRNR